ncbi:MAG TPA: PhzF family phenazine biosynthesis protein [Caulobacteraceae bacterium]
MRQWMIDAFASRPFRGNPACVVAPFEAWPDDHWMQSLASENNQAETAFLLATAEPGRFGLRWFTPAIEVPLCGHATLASAHVLLGEIGIGLESVIFDTHSGVLGVKRAGTGYEMDFPADPPKRVEAPAEFIKALGATPTEVWAGKYLIAVFDNESEVRELKPDIRALGPISAGATGGRGNIGVAAPANAGGAHDVVSRFFAPGSGIDEDPTTGSLHCILSPLFSEKLGRNTLKFHQAYPGRGGDLECELAGDRVLLRGAAVTVLEGDLRI